jgi:hypothetical protein
MGELSRRVSSLTREAQERGDRYAATNLRSSLLPLTLLAAGAVGAARREIEECMAAWSAKNFTLQHYNALLASANLDLYRDDGAAAHERMESTWHDLDKSLLLVMEQSCLEAWHLRARALIAATAPGQRAAAFKRVAALNRKVRRGNLPWALGLADLLDVAVALGRADKTAALTRLDQAIERLDGADMGLYALAARRRRGELVGGDAGKAEVDEADRRMTGEKIAHPDRWTAMLVPLFAD